MGWADGLYRADEMGDTLVKATCAEHDCDTVIEKHPKYRCGVLDGPQGWAGCGNHFCFGHLNSWSQCSTCEDLEEDPYEDAIE